MRSPSERASLDGPPWAACSGDSMRETATCEASGAASTRERRRGGGSSCSLCAADGRAQGSGVRGPCGASSLAAREAREGKLGLGRGAATTSLVAPPGHLPRLCDDECVWQHSGGGVLRAGSAGVPPGFRGSRGGNPPCCLVESFDVRLCAGPWTPMEGVCAWMIHPGL